MTQIELAERKQRILKTLAPLFEKADRTGLHFYSKELDIWLSPQALKQEQSNGILIWAAENWTLRDPRERAA